MRDTFEDGGFDRGVETISWALEKCSEEKGTILCTNGSRMENLELLQVFARETDVRGIGWTCAGATRVVASSV